MAGGLGALAAGAGASGERWTPNKLGTGYYSEEGLGSVDARSAIGDIKTLKMRVRRGASSNSIQGTDRNGSSLINLREGATSAEEAHVLMAAGLANRITDDPAAADAARRAASEAGADAPQGFVESMAANWMAYTGGTFKQTALAKGRFKQAMYAQAVKGAEAYIGGNQGNAYTEHLRSRYGAWDGDKDAYSVWQLTDPDASESAWNPGLGPATDQLSAAMLPITAATRGAIQNGYVMAQRPGAKRTAVRAVLNAAMNDDRMVGVDPSSPQGGILLGEIARSMPESIAQTAHAVYNVTGGGGLDRENLDTIAQLSGELNATPEAVTRGLNNVAGFAGVAKGGMVGMGAARGLQQVRQVVDYQNAGNPQAADTMYSNILVESSNWMRALSNNGVTSRMLMEPNFAANVGSVMQDEVVKGTSLADAGYAVSRVVGNMGSQAFRPSYAQNLIRYMNDGNNIDRCGTQDIIAIERLYSSGASSLSPMTVQVLRSIDGRGTGPLDAGMLQRVQDITSNAVSGNIDASQSVSANQILQHAPDVPLTKQNCEVATRVIQQYGSLSGGAGGVLQGEVQLIADNVVRTAGEANTLFNQGIRTAAHILNIDTDDKSVPQIMGEIQAVQPSFTPQSVSNSITNIVRHGGYDVPQLSDPTTFELAFRADNYMPTNSHRVVAIQVAERIHGADNLNYDGALQNIQAGIAVDPNTEATWDTIDDTLEANVAPRDITPARYYASRALHDYKQAHGIGKNSGPQPILQVLDRIAGDTRFNLGACNTHSTPPLDPAIWNDISSMRPWTP